MIPYGTGSKSPVAFGAVMRFAQYLTVACFSSATSLAALIRIDVIPLVLWLNGELSAQPVQPFSL